jgi:hypothetical protein
MENLQGHQSTKLFAAELLFTSWQMCPTSVLGSRTARQQFLYTFYVYNNIASIWINVSMIMFCA